MLGNRSIALLVLIFVGCERRPNLSDPQLSEERMQTESASQRINRWRSGADGAILKECTNAVIGFRRVLDARAWDTYSSTDVNKWTGEAKVEFINKVGGVEVTNLPFAFHVHFGELSASVDTVKILKAESAAWHEKMAKLDRDIRQTDETLIRDGHIPHTWVFKKGGRFAAYYVSCTAKSVVVKRETTDQSAMFYTLTLAELCEDDQKLAMRLAKAP